MSRWKSPTWKKPLGDLDRLKAALAAEWHFDDLDVDFHLIPKVQQILRKGEWKVTAAIHKDRDDDRARLVALYPGLKNEAYGIACDIGSTTIAMHLSSLLSGRTVASAGTSNPQIRFGEDLMSRVSYVMMNPDGARGDDVSRARGAERVDRQGLRRRRRVPNRHSRQRLRRESDHAPSVPRDRSDGAWREPPSRLPFPGRFRSDPPRSACR
jgi:hypothetical protein